MKAVWTGIVAASVFLLIGVAQADQGLAQSSGCMDCHTVDKKLVGPGFKDVAAKYKGDATAAASLAGKVKNGTKGTWGPIPMPANASVSDENVKKLVTWILSLK
ncbi:c-type cytochrome [Candidatus Bathyarchaeota archaeon]|nr:c-type cytochrome [Candidatus Bathyarchaeota archaeon]